MIERIRGLFHRLSLKKYTRYYLYRFIWLGCISACIPVLLIGGVYYQISMRSAVKEVTQISADSLLLAQDRLERIFGAIELSSLQLTTNPLISNSFLDGDPNEKILTHLDILKLLQIAKNSNDFINDIILYDDASEDILNTEYGFVLKKMYKYRSVLDQLMRFEPKDQCLNIIQPYMEDTLACVRFLPPSTLHKARGLLLVKLNSDLITKYLDGPAVYSAKQSMLVLDSSNHVLVHTGNQFQNASSMLNENSIKSIIKSEKNHDALLMQDSSGKRFFYSFQKTELGRIYISKISEADIYEHIGWIRWLIAFTILLFINIGVALTIVTSLHAYRPIRQLVSFGEQLRQEPSFSSHDSNDLTFILECWIHLSEKTNKIYQSMKRWEPTIKESFYQQLLEFRSYDKGLTDFKEIAVSMLNEPKAMVVLVVQLENMHKETRFERTDGPILSFIVKNVIDEMIRKQSPLEGDVIISRSGLGTAIIAFPQETPDIEMKNRLNQFASDLVFSFQNYLKLKVCIGIGNVYRQMEDIGLSYKEALEALQYRLYKDQSQVVFIQDMELSRKQSSFHYPFYIEEKLIDGLENKRWKEAEEHLKEYITAIRTSESHFTVSQCYVLLLGSITKSLIRKGYVQIFEHKLVFSLQERKTPPEVFDWFVQTVFPYYNQVADRLESPNLIVQKVCQYINEHVHEDISLVQCAELANISSSHLSKLFKKQTGMYFLDYVLNHKLKEAQYLLVNTKLTVNEIAQKIGYSERSLIRIFQKYIHMTPNQYRMTYDG
ncbi:AraC family transcriptional regulator [Paenibacillus filicis]|uniref:AraC family transcriptional regulator n=1 Tax=Paenibacillus gyeongsangnamensis TaxID=3388067 RepID=A0ABT4QJM6_9BACL|nr:helix-turn-helix domain-containing protein [Paenibacillus filicis]MCZ8517081.1 AraC family transcriptional regulator [Paenibacillus filicis]